jgi:hypothetical protein
LEEKPAKNEHKGEGGRGSVKREREMREKKIARGER